MKWSSTTVNTNNLHIHCACNGYRQCRLTTRSTSGSEVLSVCNGKLGQLTERLVTTHEVQGQQLEQWYFTVGSGATSHTHNLAVMPTYCCDLSLFIVQQTPITIFLQSRWQISVHSVVQNKQISHARTIDNFTTTRTHRATSSFRLNLSFKLQR